jgi:hypothetical protein
MGSPATIGVQRPRNLALVVLDNEHYGETGMQLSHSKFGVDLASCATACGFAASTLVSTMPQVTTLRGRCRMGCTRLRAARRIARFAAAATDLTKREPRSVSVCRLAQILGQPAAPQCRRFSVAGVNPCLSLPLPSMRRPQNRAFGPH